MDFSESSKVWFRTKFLFENRMFLTIFYLQNENPVVLQLFCRYKDTNTNVHV